MLLSPAHTPTENYSVKAREIVVLLNQQNKLAIAIQDEILAKALTALLSEKEYPIADHVIEGTVLSTAKEILMASHGEGFYESLEYNYWYAKSWAEKQKPPSRLVPELETMKGVLVAGARPRSRSFSKGLSTIPTATSYEDKKRALEVLLQTTGSNSNEDCAVISLAFQHRLQLGIEFKKEDLSPELQSLGSLPQYGMSAWPSVNGDQRLLLQLFDMEGTKLCSTDKPSKFESDLLSRGNGAMAFIFTRSGNKDGHAVLAINVRGDVFILNNSMEPGAWVMSLDEWGEQEFPRESHPQISFGFCHKKMSARFH